MHLRVHFQYQVFKVQSLQFIKLYILQSVFIFSAVEWEYHNNKVIESQDIRYFWIFAELIRSRGGGGVFVAPVEALVKG